MRRLNVYAFPVSIQDQSRSQYWGKERLQCRHYRESEIEHLLVRIQVNIHVS